MTIKPFIGILDEDYMDSFSAGYHRIQPKLNVREIRIAYPIAEDLVTPRVFPINLEQASVSKVMHAIRDIILMECADGHNYGPHDVRDYCIEIINIDNGIATISIGS